MDLVSVDGIVYKVLHTSFFPAKEKHFFLCCDDDGIIKTFPENVCEIVEPGDFFENKDD